MAAAEKRYRPVKWDELVPRARRQVGQVLTVSARLILTALEQSRRGAASAVQAPAPAPTQRPKPRIRNASGFLCRKCGLFDADTPEQLAVHEPRRA